MKVYETKQIRNVVLLGHGGAGKTTIAEAMAFVTGAISKMGKTTDGNTISDFDKEETKRGFSIATSVIPVEYKGKGGEVKINILDTPGFFDFVGETEEAATAADGAVIVVDCKSGVEVGVERAWDLCNEFKLPRMFFVTGCDADSADYSATVAALEDKFGQKVAPFQTVIREGDKNVGFCNVVSLEGAKFDGKDAKKCDVPADAQGALDEARERLMESVAETSEELMEKYFGGEDISADEVAEAVKTGIAECEMAPVFLGSGLNAQGIKALLEAIELYVPTPDANPVTGKKVPSGEEFVARFDSSANFCGQVFKTIVDPFIGKYTLVKVYNGTLKSDSTFFNVTKDTEEKTGKLYVLRGKEAMEVPEIKAGDIGAMAKLNATRTGDSLAIKADQVEFPELKISKPYTYMAYFSVNKGEEDKIATGIAKLMDEDPTLKSVVDKESKQSLIYAIGDQQLDIVKSKLKDRYKVDVTLDKPKFNFRETIRKAVEAPGRYKKQSGGHGQFGDVKMRFEPLQDQEKAYEFAEEVFGGSVPKNYFPAVEKGIAESCEKGPLAAYPVVGVKAVLYDGSYHPVDSSEMAFKKAASMAFKAGFMNANPVLLEPIAKLDVTVPDSFTGDVMGDLNKRRGRVLGMEHNAAGKQVVSAEVPMSELFGYNTDLRSMTGGIGTYEYHFDHYEQAPSDVQAKQVAERAALLAGGDED